MKIINKKTGKNATGRSRTQESTEYNNIQTKYDNYWIIKI